MAKQFTKAETCRIAAQSLRELADRIAAGELIPTDIETRRETVERPDYDRGMMVSVPTPFRVVTIRLEDAVSGS